VLDEEICILIETSSYVFLIYFKPAMSNPNGLLSQEVCDYLDQGRALNNIIEGRTWNGLLWS